MADKAINVETNSTIAKRTERVRDGRCKFCPSNRGCNSKRSNRRPDKYKSKRKGVND